MAGQHPYRADGIANSDLIKGWRFGATLQLRTPLFVLQRHGEVVLGVDRELPEYGPSWAGMWLPVLRTWGELGVMGPKLPVGTMASEIGQIHPDGGQFLVFLKEYRAIIEADSPVAIRLDGIRRLLADPRYVEITSKLRPYAAAGWAIAELGDELHVQGGIASALFNHGLLDAKAVRSATDEELLAIPGIGKKRLGQIRGRSEPHSPR